MEGDQRVPAWASLHGHRKLTGAGSTLLAGEVAGQDAIAYVWNSVILVLNSWANIPLEPMSPKTASDIFALLAMAAFYKVRET